MRPEGDAVGPDVRGELREPMPIDVLNHIWVGVFSASFVQQCADEQRLTGDCGSSVDRSVIIAEEAAAVADMALEAYRLMPKPSVGVK